MPKSRVNEGIRVSFTLTEEERFDVRTEGGTAQVHRLTATLPDGLGPSTSGLRYRKDGTLGERPYNDYLIWADVPEKIREWFKIEFELALQRLCNTAYDKD